ncbi:hypothetical protein [Candidatus Pelagibacter sp. HIMB1493]|uniref:hypothetical protein n=1 Tax=Candidatus Pelagibacter sp. HIMB1493 TaxID=3413334 RepID=UPI003F85EC6C
MIICHSKKFIFLRPRKCASSTIELYLSSWCDATDIITYDHQVEEIKKIYSPKFTKYNLGKKVLNLDNIIFNFKNIIKKYSFFKFKNPVEKLRNFSIYKYQFDLPPHINAKELKKNLYFKNQTNNWKNYKKISILRDPVTQFLSACNQKYIDNSMSLKQKVNKYAKLFFSINNVYSINEIPICDFFIRYEHLDEDINKLYKLLNLKNEMSFYDFQNYNIRINDPKIKKFLNKIHSIDEFDDDDIKKIKHEASYIYNIYNNI